MRRVKGERIYHEIRSPLSVWFTLDRAPSGSFLSSIIADVLIVDKDFSGTLGRRLFLHLVTAPSLRSRVTAKAKYTLR